MPEFTERRVIDPAMLDLAIEAFAAAAERVEVAWSAALKAAPEDFPRTMYVPLTEATWWAICVDEEFHRAEGYRSIRNSDPRGKVVAGLHYARSYLGHHLFVAARRSGGMRFPPFDGTGKLEFDNDLTWHRLDEMPPIHRQSRYAKPCYESHVAGRRVVDTLSDARAWFAGSRTRHPSEEQGPQPGPII